MRNLLKALALSATFCSPALAADLPVRKAAPIVPAPAYSPFYIGLEGGMGFTDTENVISQLGVAVGSPKLFPTAPSVGAVVGYLDTTNSLAYGFELFGDFNFSQQSLNCVGGICAARARNSFSVGEDFLFGITLGQLIAVNPTNVQPQNWKFPIVVPASLMSNFMLLGSIGGAQRSAGLCTTDVVTLAESCGSEWMGGLSAGAQARFVVAGQWDVALKYHHNFYNHSFTGAQSLPVLANTVSAKGEDTIKFGLNYHFSGL